ncbi:hypothetical protein CHS0354_002933 [Potamilus streckersoni]|nr:hypothetical protein CHS0354_002933 [Potamilus streckersoni]
MYIRQLGKGVVIKYINDNNGGTFTDQTTSTSTWSTTSARSTTTIQPTVEPRLDCKAGYVLYTGLGTPFCYRYDTKCLTWDEAQKVCQTEGTDLAVLDAQSLPGLGDIMNRIFQAGPRICPPSNGIWIGAMTRVDDFVAEYIDGTTISSSNPLWQDGYPFIGNQCVQYNTDVNDQRKLRIVTQRCDFTSAIVCQQRR